MENTSSRYTLRDLPLPAKLVVTVFLISVGLGYCWAIMQLHFKHADKGDLMPGVDAVVARFSGVCPPWKKEEAAPAENRAEPKKEQANPPEGKRAAEPRGREPVAKAEPKKGPEQAPPKMVAAARIKKIIDTRCAVCHSPDGEEPEKPLDNYTNLAKYFDPSPQKGQIHHAIAPETEGNFTPDNMTAAFTTKSKVYEGDDEIKWKQQVAKSGMTEDQLRAERETERLLVKAWLEAGAPEEAYTKDAFPIPDEIKNRPLAKAFVTQAPAITKVATDAANAAANTAKRRKNAKDCQLSVESLTQSTHAHLLSFSMLWALTGLTFAFTTYPLWMRCTLAPVVLIFQIIDISFWWLARLPEIGPYFAVGIMGTGAVVGLGLIAQIVLSLFNMYGGKGKAVLLLLFLAAGAGGGLVFTKYIQPHIAAEKEAG